MEKDVCVAIELAFKPLIQEMVDNPAAVQIEQILTGNSTVVVTILVDKSDAGKVIGKMGRHADALRTLIKAVAAAHKHRAIIGGIS